MTSLLKHDPRTMSFTITMDSKRVMQSVNTITLLQFNMLADSLIGKGFSNVDSKFLQWQHRKPLIVSILKQYTPDIICIQECDKFEEIQEEFKTDYHCSWAKKCGTNVDHKDGVVTLVKKTIVVEQTERIQLDRHRSQVALMQLLRKENFQFILATTHLKSNEFESMNKNENFDQIREEQVHSIHYSLDVSFDLHKHKYPLILCGDLNEDRNGLALQYLEKYLHLQSAYADVKDCFTTNKKRTTKIKCVEEDYILFSPHFKVCERLSLPSKDEFLPNETYPSDHVFLVAKLCF